MKFSHIRTSGFAATRSRLGLSQSQLAAHLGISKAAIGMAETGRRSLPVPALLKLAELEIKMAAALIPAMGTAAKEIDIDLPLQATSVCIEIRELQCELRVQKLSNLLETMTVQYKRFYTQLQLLEGMLEKETGEQGNMFILCMQLHRDRILKQLGRCSLTEQALLRNRIALLGAESHLNKSVRQQMI
ncbi:MAG TPA: helix-turn-helix transcriptional regulator [Chitinophagaceae bacterium]|jgi:transcriptional regulator with XRE-family HTH domain|nr:helix-turn-helix transcriptional regulator [Chitinophagaceae bacterium]